MRFPFPSLAPTLALVLFAAIPLRAQTAAVTDDALVLPAITVSTIATHRMRDIIPASGLVGPVEQVQVQPLIEGQPIESLLADVGDHVTAGQVLATLSNSTLELQKSQLLASQASARATIAQADAQLLDAKSSSDEAIRVATRTAALNAQGSASNAARDQAQANAISATSRVTVATQSLAAAQANLTLVDAQISNLELQLSRTQVVAPVSGEITERNAQLGSIASAAGQPMFVLIRDSQLELRADISEGDLMRLAIGQKAQLKLSGSAEILTGTVRLIEPTIDLTSRLGRARISIDDNSKVRSGMFVVAEVIVSDRDTLAVPVTAVGSSDGKSTVMLVTDAVAVRTAVETGVRDGGWIEITSGLQTGDLVVTKAGAFVRNGDKINPIPELADTN